MTTIFAPTRSSALESAAPRDIARSFTFQELRHAGFSRRKIDHLLANGDLVRLRKGFYVGREVPVAFVRAGELGGRADCLSLLRHLGVFVLDHPVLHVQLGRSSGRLPPVTDAVVRHWRDSEAPSGDLGTGAVEALVQACRCQPPRAAVATLDSAWHLGLIGEEHLSEIFRKLPRRCSVLYGLLDPRSESGPESFMRLLLRTLGCRVELQVTIAGVGRVDFVVDGWLIIECDSEAHHAGWVTQKRDRRRDLAAAAQGYVTLRPIAEDLMHHADEVLAAVRGLLAARQAVATAHSAGRFRTRSPRRV